MSAAVCLCGRDRAKTTGDPIEVGDVVGSGTEPGMRYARVVGSFKREQETLKAARVLIREFRPGDGRWPTGSYARAWLIVPWAHDHPCIELDRWSEPVDWSTGPFAKAGQR